MQRSCGSKELHKLVALKGSRCRNEIHLLEELTGNRCGRRLANDRQSGVSWVWRGWQGSWWKVDFILVIMESCWSVLNRRVINSDLRIIKRSLWLLCWRLGEGWQECNKGNWIWLPGGLGVKETVVSRTNPRFLTWAIKWMMVLFTEILKKWGENARKCQSMLRLD